METNAGRGSVNYKLTVSDITYPLVDVVVGEETVEGEGHLEQVYLPDGSPDIEIILDDDGNSIKKPKFIFVPKMRKLLEAQPDLDGIPDGIAYEVLAWDLDGVEADAIPLKFHMGRSAFENVVPAERAGLLQIEIEIKYKEARASWLEGLELVEAIEADGK